MVRRVGWLLWLLTVGCAGNRAAEVSTEETVPVARQHWRIPASMAAELTRERLDLPTHPLTVPRAGHPVQLEVPALRAPRVQDNRIAVELDEKSTASCHLEEPAGMLAHAIRNRFLAVRGLPQLDRRVLSLSMPVQQGVAVFMLSVEYLTPEDVYGVYRIAAASTPEADVVCTMDAPGHVRTLARLVASLARGLSHGVEPRWLSYTVSINGRPLGTGHQRNTVRADGTRVQDERSHLLIIRGGELLAEDGRRQERTRPDGTLLEATDETTVDGKVETKARVASLPDGRYQATPGPDGPLAPEALLTDDLLRAWHRTAMLKEDTTPVAFESYLAREQRGWLESARLEFVARRGDGAVFRMYRGGNGEGVMSERTVDANGELLRSETRRPGSVFVIERVAAHGE